jgi:hypothetical protein
VEIGEALENECGHPVRVAGGGAGGCCLPAFLTGDGVP